MGDRVDQRLANVIRAAVAYDEAERRGSSAQMTPRRKALVIAINDYNDAVRCDATISLRAPPQP